MNKFERAVVGAVFTLGTFDIAAYAYTIGHAFGEHMVDPSAQMPPVRDCAEIAEKISGSKIGEPKVDSIPVPCQDSEDAFTRISMPNGEYVFRMPSASALINGKKAWLRANEVRRPDALGAAFAALALTVEGAAIGGVKYTVRRRRETHPGMLPVAA